MKHEHMTAFPLSWPTGWRRTPAHQRTGARFNRRERQNRDGSSWTTAKQLSVSDATARVLHELEAMGIDRQDVILSTNVRLRLDGLPRSGERNPDDPGAAVYWRAPGEPEMQCMGIDQYDTVEGNIAAIAATLEHMRGIARHGGAPIMKRAFSAFIALPNLESWWQVLKLDSPDVTGVDIEQAYRRLISEAHPDKGGTDDDASRLNRAREQGLEAIR